MSCKRQHRRAALRSARSSPASADSTSACTAPVSAAAGRSNATPTADRSSLATGRASRASTMSAPSRDSRTPRCRSISSAAASRARTSATSANAPGCRAHAPASGANTVASSKRSPLVTSSSKTSRPCDSAGSTRSCVTLPRSGMMRSGRLCPRPPLAPDTSATAYSLLPSHVALRLARGDADNRLGLLKWFAARIPICWPTPVAMLSCQTRNGGRLDSVQLYLTRSARFDGKLEIQLGHAVKFWPALIETRNMDRPFSRRHTPRGGWRIFETARARTGSLNADWTDWLMGFPVGWSASGCSASAASATRSCRRSPSSSASASSPSTARPADPRPRLEARSLPRRDSARPRSPAPRAAIPRSSPAIGQTPHARPILARIAQPRNSRSATRPRAAGSTQATIPPRLTAISPVFSRAKVTPGIVRIRPFVQNWNNPRRHH